MSSAGHGYAMMRMDIWTRAVWMPGIMSVLCASRDCAISAATSASRSASTSASVGRLPHFLLAVVDRERDVIGGAPSLELVEQRELAAPVHDVGGVVAAVHAHGPSYRFPGERSASEISALVVAAAERISARLSA